MKRFGLVALLVVLAVPGRAHAAACTPLDCAPSQFLVAHGTLLATRGSAQGKLRVIDLRTGATRWRLPPGVVTRNTLVSRRDGRISWYDVATGRLLRSVELVLPSYSLVGTSQDAARAVLEHAGRKSASFVIAGRAGSVAVHVPGGNWGFDALSGSHLILIQYLRYGYHVRLYDLAAQRLVARALKDPGESALVQGVPAERASSPDGRYLFTLYVNGDSGAAMIHELDLRRATARCIDLPGAGSFTAGLSWGIAVTGHTLWAVSPGYHRVVAIDAATHRVTTRFGFANYQWTSNAGMAAVSPDGRSVAVTDAEHVWLVDVATRKVRLLGAHVAVALAFSPDGQRLVGVGERSRVFSLRVNR